MPIGLYAFECQLPVLAFSANWLVNQLAWIHFYNSCLVCTKMPTWFYALVCQLACIHLYSNCMLCCLCKLASKPTGLYAFVCQLNVMHWLVCICMSTACYALLSKLACEPTGLHIHVNAVECTLGCSIPNTWTEFGWGRTNPGCL